MKTKQQLQNRWTFDLSSQITLSNRPQSSFGMTKEGLVDFRGLGHPVRHNGDCGVFDKLNNKLCDLSFDSCDLSFGAFPNAAIERCSFRDCVFSGTDFSYSSITACSFINCKFKACTFHGADIGATWSFDETVFSDVEFERCRFATTSFFAPFFRRCLFDRCSKQIRFRASAFEDSSFSGQYETLWFSNGWPFFHDEEYGPTRQNRMRNVSFARASVTSFTFTHQCPLDLVDMPKTGKYVHLFRFHDCLETIRMEAMKQTGIIQEELLFFYELYNCRAGQSGEHPEYETQEEYLFSLDFLENKIAPHSIALIAHIFQAYQNDASE